MQRQDLPYVSYSTLHFLPLALYSRSTLDQVPNATLHFGSARLPPSLLSLIFPQCKLCHQEELRIGLIDGLFEERIH